MLKLLELNLQHICANHRSIGTVIGCASICIRQVSPSHSFFGTPLRVISPIILGSKRTFKGTGRLFGR